MFGIIRPCRHRLSEKLHTAWTAHLCGLCLALRDGHGQLARVATNYDGLIISVLVEAQTRAPEAAGRRKAGPCPLRAMRTADVSTGEGARLAAAVSLVLASAKMADHVEDRDGVFARRTVAAGARRVAGRWARQGADTASGVGFDTDVMVEAVRRQSDVEALAGPGTPVLTVTEPTETATAAAFAHTAVIAGLPGNAAPLAEAGRLFGRLAHLLDAVEDVYADRAAEAWNPLLATKTSPAEAYRLCRDAVQGIRLALRDVEFADGELAHRLLAHEVEASVERVFAHAGYPVAPKSKSHRGACALRTTDSDVASASGPGNPFGPQAPPGTDWPPQAPQQPGGPQEPDRRGPRHNPFTGCALWMGLCCTCQLCCREEFHDPCTGEPKRGWCVNGSSGDPGCGECCSCCECCEGCDCCGDCSCDCSC